MTIDSRYFVDVFGSVVDDVQALYDPTNEEKPYYMYGHILDVLKRLTIKDTDDTEKLKKYPLIVLIQDFEEVKSEWGKYEYILPEIKVVIVTDTSQNYTSDKRYTKSFKPILYPIWNNLLTSMAKSNYIDVVSPDHIEYSKFDRVFWGKEAVFGVDGSPFNDYLDAIEIRFKNLQIIKHKNC
jgi:hypothetical protein